MPNSSGQFGKLLEPGLRKIFFNNIKAQPMVFQQVFNVLSSKKAVETDYRLGGFSEWNEKGSQDSTEYEDILAGDPIMYRHTTFSKGFNIEKELYDDEQYNIMNKRAAALGRAANSTIERKAATVYNNAFSTNGYDGVPLISASHPRLDNGGNVTNLVPSNPALSETSLEDAITIAMKDQVDERGVPIVVQPKILLVAPDNYLTARKILESVQSTTPGGTGGNFARNDKNVIKGSLRPVSWVYLTNPTAWFLIDPSIMEVNFFWREKINFKGTNIDFDTDVAKYKGRMRFSYGFSDFRGIIGSNGSGV